MELGVRKSSPSWGSSEYLVELLQWRVYHPADSLWRKSASFSRQESCSWLTWAVPWGTCTSATLVIHLIKPQRQAGYLLEPQMLSLGCFPSVKAWKKASLLFEWMSVWEGSPGTHIFPCGLEIHHLSTTAWSWLASLLQFVLLNSSISLEPMISIQIKLRHQISDISKQYW